MALSGSQTELATTEGDYTYNLSCDNFCGDSASDEVAVTVDFCGNGNCDAFETCAVSIVRTIQATSPLPSLAGRRSHIGLWVDDKISLRVISATKN